jgi:hypothetical protein
MGGRCGRGISLGQLALSRIAEWWDPPTMNRNHAPDRGEPASGEVKDDELPHPAPATTGQLRTVGQRRRDAELKLAHHLQEARHKNEPHNGNPETVSPG